MKATLHRSRRSFYRIKKKLWKRRFGPHHFWDLAFIQDEATVNDKLKLVPGHCDPTCNVHDWYVGVRNGKVEKIWPITARGLAY